MFILLPLAAVLLAALIQGIIRGSSGAAEAPSSLRQAARALLITGGGVSIAPIIPLLFDVVAVKSPAELLTIAVFVLVALAAILPAWIWTLFALKGSGTRSAAAFALAVAVVNLSVAVTLYRGLTSGSADEQDGIVVTIVPLVQLVVVATSAAFRKMMDQRPGAGIEGRRAA